MNRWWCLFAVFALITAAAGCTGGSPYHGEKMPAPERYNAHFGDIDAGGDGLVSWEEFRSYFPRAEPKVYAALDLDKDGFVDHDEWHEFKAAHGLKHEE